MVPSKSKNVITTIPDYFNSLGGKKVFISAAFIGTATGIAVCVSMSDLPNREYDKHHRNPIIIVQLHTFAELKVSTPLIIIYTLNKYYLKPGRPLTVIHIINPYTAVL